MGESVPASRDILNGEVSPRSKPLHLPSVPFYNTPPCEAAMPFSIRSYRRVPVCCPVIYQTGLFEDEGTVWNLSFTGWRFSGDLPLRIGKCVR